VESQALVSKCQECLGVF